MEYWQDYLTDVETPKSPLLAARITQVHRGQVRVMCALGEINAALTGALVHKAVAAEDFPAVGDLVHLLPNPHGVSGITRILPRKSKFSRPDYAGHKAEYVKTIVEQVVASNFDTVFILDSLNQNFKPRRIARYLSAAWQSGGQPVVVLTKADLCRDTTPYVQAVKDIAPDVPVLPVSNTTGQGLDNFKPYLARGQIIVCLGSSGVGKSSLINALAGEELMAVSDIREDDSRGRHTTTHRQMLHLPSGVLLIDTPGMRELGLWNAEEGMQTLFSDVEALFDQCKFRNCTHQTEPKCAVQRALADGSLPIERWEQYNKQKNEALFTKRRQIKPAKNK